MQCNHGKAVTCTEPQHTNMFFGGSINNSLKKKRFHKTELNSYFQFIRKSLIFFFQRYIRLGIRNDHLVKS